MGSSSSTQSIVIFLRSISLVINRNYRQFNTRTLLHYIDQWTSSSMQAIVRNYCSVDGWEKGSREWTIIWGFGVHNRPLCKSFFARGAPGECKQIQKGISVNLFVTFSRSSSLVWDGSIHGQIRCAFSVQENYSVVLLTYLKLSSGLTQERRIFPADTS